VLPDLSEGSSWHSDTSGPVITVDEERDTMRILATTVAESAVITVGTLMTAWDISHIEHLAELLTL